MNQYLKKERRKVNREAQYQRILTCSNENNRPAYAIQNTANNLFYFIFIFIYF
jgi:hypothetical protein